MKIDRDEGACFYPRFAFVSISHSANKGVCIDSMQKSGQK